MCFSATASFIAAGTLAGTSALSFRLLKHEHFKMYALIPLFFGIQQAIEGFQWVLLEQGRPNAFLAYAFLFFAFLFWPIYMPVAALQIERNQERRNALGFLLLCGILTSLYLFLCLILMPLDIRIVGHSIQYGVEHVPFHFFLIGLYVLATCGSGLVVRRFWIRAFSLLTFAALLMSELVYTYAFASVWCFFGAALSILIVLEIRSHTPKEQRVIAAA